MRRFDFKPVGMEDIPAMADLLVHRQTIEGEVFPFLNNSCLHLEYITELLGKLFVNKKVIGMGAFINNELVGYIIGEIKIDSIRGRHVWVPYEGIAIRMDQSSELIRNLYAEVSVAWLEQGCFMHYAIIPLGSEVYFDATQRLSFSIQQVHAVMNIQDYKPFENVSDAQIRVANELDGELMGKMSDIIQAYQNAAPTFEPALPEVVLKINEAYKTLVAEANGTCLIAMKDEKEIGFQEYCPIPADLMTPDNGVELGIAGTYSSEMGRGVGKKLMNEGCRMMKEKGYSSMVTDWRITNMASSAFWPKCGFTPLAYRMVRHINSDIAWANFNNPGIKMK
ncbi:GNAT family N-acetyltransferase [Ureibacillus sinduriensis]|uniref:N-acetyltransferase domain-containing protein n=1 Tax=Ureibacillus sinduriensis BLB-1 = JCM 15800 TaxID=1384057 RepID=A0A0A3IMV1_9BACL|nr:GNAT family N-acetyltransferase [Ureibacillus sinduriensis]KGR76167.1 hypothetical protein CD33_08350 [Ureibacillus sinduriensis BLB-1 = JCM 15800]